MKIRCLAIDDELPALEKLVSYIRRIPYLELIDKCDNTYDAGNIIASHDGIDAIFVDINMPDQNGLDFVDSLDTPPMIVFITAYPQYAVDSYRTGAVDYLLKPYSFDDFQRAAGRLVERAGLTDTAREPAATDDSFFIKVDNRWIKLRPEQVEYIRGFGDYMRVYVNGRDTPLVSYSTLNAVKSILPPDFVQVHRSFIVNMSRVTAVERTRIITPQCDNIPVGESFRDTLMEYLNARTVGKEPRRKHAL